MSTLTSALSWCGTLGMSTAPLLISFDHTIADTLGGESRTITGLRLGSAISCTVGGTSASITANTSTSLTFTMPAKAAGPHSVQVTTANGASNTLSIEAWSPAEEPSCTLLAEAPDYSVLATVGTWTPRVGVTPTSGAGAGPSAVGGAPNFVSSRLVLDVIANIFNIASQSTAAGTACFVYRPTSLTAGALVSSPCILGDMGRGAMGILCTTSGCGFGLLEAGTSVFRTALVPVTAGVDHAIVTRFQANGTIDTQINGKNASGVSGFTSTAITGYSVGTGVEHVNIGSGYTANTHPGLMKVAATFNTKISDTVADKFNRWVAARHISP